MVFVERGMEGGREGAQQAEGSGGSSGKSGSSAQRLHKQNNGGAPHEGQRPLGRTPGVPARTLVA